MLNISKNKLKFQMLNEFEKELDYIIEEYNKKTFTNKKCIDSINTLFDVWNCCRLDLKNHGNKNNLINIIKNNELYISYPSWFKNDEGTGCQIVSNCNKIDLTFNSNNNGKLNIDLRGLNYKNNNKRVPVYINCKKFVINNKKLLKNNNLIYHDDPYNYKINYKQETTFNIHIEFDTIYDYYPLLKMYLSDINNENLLLNYQTIKSYITYEKMLIKLNEVESEIYKAIRSL